MMRFCNPRHTFAGYKSNTEPQAWSSRIKIVNPIGITEIVGRDGRTTVVSDISPAMSDVAQATMLTECISKEVFPYKKFVTLEAELDYGMTLQKRICYKMNVLQEQDTWWSSRRELVRKKLAKKGTMYKKHCGRK